MITGCKTKKMKREDIKKIKNGNIHLKETGDNIDSLPQSKYYLILNLNYLTSYKVAKSPRLLIMDLRKEKALN